MIPVDLYTAAGCPGGERMRALLVRTGCSVRSRDLFAQPLSRDDLNRRLVLPVVIQTWSLTSFQQRLFKTGGRLVRHARYFILQLAESYLTGPLFRQILQRIERLGWHST